MKEIINSLKDYGPLGLFFLSWLMDRYFIHLEIERDRERIEKQIGESNKKWYDLGQKLETHLLVNIGALTEVKGSLGEIKDRIDVLLHRGDR